VSVIRLEYKWKLLIRIEEDRRILKRAKFRLHFHVKQIIFLTNNLSKNRGNETSVGSSGESQESVLKKSTLSCTVRKK